MENKSTGWNPKGGRPKKEDKDKRDKQLLLKLTEDEFEELNNQYKDAGYTNR